MPDFSNSKSGIHEDRTYKVRLLGTGAASPTVSVGAGEGITVTWTATGKFTMTFGTSPGTFVNCHFMFGAATIANVKGQTCAYSLPSTSAAGVVTMAFAMWDSTFTLDDLQATETLSITLTFAETDTP